jgi:hypothetical protein
MSRQALGELAGGLVQGGKAVVLARTAGVRAARGAHEVLDGYAEKYAGPVELDARLDASLGGYVWQAHVSTAEGEFFAAASMLAAVTAAVALRDSIAAKDPTSTIDKIALCEEAWSVGSGAFGDEATVTYMKAPSATSGSHARLVVEAPDAAPSSPSAPPSRGVPVWVALLLVLATLLAFASAGLTIQKTGGFKRAYSMLM